MQMLVNGPLQTFSHLECFCHGLKGTVMFRVFLLLWEIQLKLGMVHTQQWFGEEGGAAKEAWLPHVHPFLPGILLESTVC